MSYKLSCIHNKILFFFFFFYKVLSMTNLSAQHVFGVNYNKILVFNVCERIYTARFRVCLDRTYFAEIEN